MEMKFQCLLKRCDENTLKKEKKSCFPVQSLYLMLSEYLAAHNRATDGNQKIINTNKIRSVQ